MQTPAQLRWQQGEGGQAADLGRSADRTPGKAAGPMARKPLQKNCPALTRLQSCHTAGALTRCAKAAHDKSNVDLRCHPLIHGAHRQDACSRQGIAGHCRALQVKSRCGTAESSGRSDRIMPAARKPALVSSHRTAHVRTKGSARSAWQAQAPGSPRKAPSQDQKMSRRDGTGSRVSSPPAHERAAGSSGGGPSSMCRPWACSSKRQGASVSCVRQLYLQPTYPPTHL